MSSTKRRLSLPATIRRSAPAVLYAARSSRTRSNISRSGGASEHKQTEQAQLLREKQEEWAQQKEVWALRDAIRKKQWAQQDEQWAQQDEQWAQQYEQYNSLKKQIYEKEKNKLEKIKINEQHEINNVDNLYIDKKITLEEYNLRTSAIHEKYNDMQMTIIDITTNKLTKHREKYEKETRLHLLFFPYSSSHSHHVPVPLLHPKHDGGAVTSLHPLLASRHFSRK